MYAWIKQHSEDYSISILCKFMKVSRSCYYQWLNAPKTKREKENDLLIEQLEILFKKGRGSYGTRRLKNRFAEQGVIVSRRRLGRLMEQAGLWCKTKKKFKVTTDSKHNQPIAPNGLVWHTDRGSQYASDSHRAILEENHIIQSMSGKGNCWDNAVSESFFHTLKTELIHHGQFKNRNEAKQTIVEYIEVFYNRERIHSANGYLSPVEYENQQKAG